MTETNHAISMLHPQVRMGRKDAIMHYSQQENINNLCSIEFWKPVFFQAIPSSFLVTQSFSQPLVFSSHSPITYVSTSSHLSFSYIIFRFLVPSTGLLPPLFCFSCALTLTHTSNSTFTSQLSILIPLLCGHELV